MRFDSESEQQTMELAERLAGQLRAGDIVALEGPLGSGKTCFVRGLARGLGLDPGRVSSPTFVICQEYSEINHKAQNTEDKAVIALIHIDAYRLKGSEELESIGWNELLEAGDAIIAVEWAGRIAQALPKERISISFEHAGEQARRITIEARDGIADHLRSMTSRIAHTSKNQATCRSCGKPIAGGSASQFFPFCSERCKMADLGKWFSEGYRVSRPVQPEEEDVAESALNDSKPQDREE